MKSLLGVAHLDIRRLGVGLVSAGLFAGLIPSLSSGLSSPVPITTVLNILLFVVGAVAGGTFGSDFVSGRSSFYFARPLSTTSLIAGRAAALFILAAAVVSAATGSYWLASSERASVSLPLVPPSRLWLLLAAYGVALYAGLAVAAGYRRSASPSFWRPRLLGLVRVTLATGAFLAAFGLAADVVVRAYSQAPTPMEVFLKLSIVALVVICIVTIAAGRAESSRIGRFQGRLTAFFLALACLLTAAAWNYVLHPEPGDIEGFRGLVRSPNGRVAFVQTLVNRGDPGTFRPVFHLDLDSGHLTRLDVDPGQGPWMSADGRTIVWSEATPFFFRPLLRALGRTDTFRVRTDTGEIRNLPLPGQLSTGGFDISSLFRTVASVQPSNDGELFAIRWGQHLTVTSRTRGELLDVDFRATRRAQAASLWIPSGRLRVAASRRDGAQEGFEFLDLDPETGLETPVGPVVPGAGVQFDREGARALVTSRTWNGRVTLSLVEMDGRYPGGRRTALLDDVIGGSALFMADGRIATTSGVRGSASIALFSEDGQSLWRAGAPEDAALSLGTEIFPGVLAVGLLGIESRELALVDGLDGRILRRIPSVYPLPGPAGASAPETPAARLLASQGNALVELPSLSAEPRQLLPLPRR